MSRSETTLRRRNEALQAENGILREMVNHLLDSPSIEQEVNLRKRLRQFIRERSDFYRPPAAPVLSVDAESLARAFSLIAKELADGRLETTLMRE